jgi:hypothetical protein
MSQPAICNKCKDAGFPNELIKFQQDGTKADGSKKWKVLNASDGSEHVHKTQEAPKPAPQKTTITTNQPQSKLIAVLTGDLAKTFIEVNKRGSTIQWMDKSRDGVSVMEVYEELSK